MDEPGRPQRRRPYVIGITGNIGAGKSTVSRLLTELGAATIDADKVAHRVMRPGAAAHARIVQTFGPEVVLPSGQIDRARLGAIVFRDPAALDRLEEIVHPATIAAINRQIARARAAVVAVEAIKLIEAGMAASVDSIWVVVAGREQQIERIMGRGLSRAEAEQRIDAQSPPELKLALADVVIDNSGSLDETRQQVRAAWQQSVGASDGANRTAQKPA